MEQSKDRGEGTEGRAKGEGIESVPKDSVGVVELTGEFFEAIGAGIRLWATLCLFIAVLMVWIMKRAGESNDGE